MKHLTALIIKYVFVAVATYVALRGSHDQPAGPLLWVAAVLTLALYLLGDLMILPALGNVVATLADAGVALLLVWLAPLYSAVARVPFSSALYVAVLIGVAEYFFHRYVQREVLARPAPGDIG